MPRRCDAKAVLRYYHAVLRTKDWARLEKYIREQRIKRNIQPRSKYPLDPPDKVLMHQNPTITFREKNMELHKYALQKMKKREKEEISFLEFVRKKEER